jgi:hypothetical protein
MVEQLLGLAGVFAGDAVNPLQHVQRAQGDVSQVADGCGDKIQARCERREVLGYFHVSMIRAASTGMKAALA